MRFEMYAARYPVGTVIEPHRVLDARRWPEWAPDPPCPGQMVVADTNWPVVALQCDKCGFETRSPPATCNYSTNGPDHDGAPLTR